MHTLTGTGYTGVVQWGSGYGCRLTSLLRPFCVEFVCSPHASLGFLQVLWVFTSQVKLIGDSKLPTTLYLVSSLEGQNSDLSVNSHENHHLTSEQCLQQFAYMSI